jgi:AbrB family looped-hinge helix DNA binding protein
MMSAVEKKSTRGRVSSSGQIELPADFRKAIGLEHGGDVVLEMEGQEIRIRTIADVVSRAQELSRRLLQDRPQSSVDDFLAERRRDWGGA